jgi:hypothetical protein
MSRGPARFTKRDLAKAMKAVAAAGLSVAEIRVDKDGARIVVVGEPGKATGERNEWDDDQD